MSDDNDLCIKGSKGFKNPNYVKKVPEPTGSQQTPSGTTPQSGTNNKVETSSSMPQFLIASMEKMFKK